MLEICEEEVAQLERVREVTADAYVPIVTSVPGPASLLPGHTVTLAQSPSHPTQRTVSSHEKKTLHQAGHLRHRRHHRVHVLGHGDRLAPVLEERQQSAGVCRLSR